MVKLFFGKRAWKEKVMGYVERGAWIVEPGDVLTICRPEGSISKSAEACYMVTSVDGANLNIRDNRNMSGYPIKPMHQLEEYIDRDVMVEDWTRRRTNKIVGYVGVLSKRGEKLVIKPKAPEKEVIENEELDLLRD